MSRLEIAIFCCFGICSNVRAQAVECFDGSCSGVEDDSVSLLQERLSAHHREASAQPEAGKQQRVQTADDKASAMMTLSFHETDPFSAIKHIFGRLGVTKILPASLSDNKTGDDWGVWPVPGAGHDPALTPWNVSGITKKINTLPDPLVHHNGATVVATPKMVVIKLPPRDWHWLEIPIFILAVLLCACIACLCARTVK
mmetsp:Transcript_109010/g.170412  ORF Transcript_109010/g.170412 Transcript_109010/m.170412 type:complete len:199 (-) Transcript_109010:77-673(-)